MAGVPGCSVDPVDSSLVDLISLARSQNNRTLLLLLLLKPNNPGCIYCFSTKLPITPHVALIIQKRSIGLRIETVERCQNKYDYGLTLSAFAGNAKRKALR